MEEGNPDNTTDNGLPSVEPIRTVRVAEQQPGRFTWGRRRRVYRGGTTDDGVGPDDTPDDGVDPEPPPRSEDGAGDPRPHDVPNRPQAIRHLCFRPPLSYVKYLSLKRVRDI